MLNIKVGAVPLGRKERRVRIESATTPQEVERVVQGMVELQLRGAVHRWDITLDMEELPKGLGAELPRELSIYRRRQLMEANEEEVERQIRAMINHSHNQIANRTLPTSENDAGLSSTTAEDSQP